ncbi:MAG: replication-associated recombination protein A [bacterium]
MKDSQENQSRSRGNDSLFPGSESSVPDAHRPLAERMRPATIDEFAGQLHLVGPKGALRPLLDTGKLHSMLFWGDPGSGKTTLARLIADRINARFESISAVTSGVKDVRNMIEQASLQRQRNRQTVLFIDEIHRFNKAQQDALLHAVEEGTVTLIGATTENPSFEVISPLLSRCRVYRFHPLTNEELSGLLDRALVKDDVLREADVTFSEEAREALLGLALGDARELMNLIERAVEQAQHDKVHSVSLQLIEQVAQQALSRYDKTGDRHYDTISAFIKCVRDSDPDAAVYWLARMIDAGEDPLFIARRLIILASEDIGNANPNGLLLAEAAFEAVHKVGMPEGRILLSQVTTYLAASPKSNASYRAIEEALEEVSRGNQPPVPLHLRNAVTGLMKAQGYHEGYEYAHNHEDQITSMENLPESLAGRRFYQPRMIGSEAQIAQRLEQIHKGREQLQRTKGKTGGSSGENES